MAPAKGMTAKGRKAVPAVRMGAMMKRILLAKGGVKSSLNSSLSRSATGCSSPQGPTRLGP